MPKKKDTGLPGVEALFQTPVEEAEPADEVVAAKVKKPTRSSKREKQKNDPGKLRQTTVMLHDKEMDWLDEKVMEVRKNGGKALRKTALVRALINLAIASPVDIKGVKSEEELVERFEQADKNK